MLVNRRSTSDESLLLVYEELFNYSTQWSIEKALLIIIGKDENEIYFCD